MIPLAEVGRPFFGRTINLPKNPVQTLKISMGFPPTIQIFMFLLFFSVKMLGGYIFKYWTRWYQIIGGCIPPSPGICGHVNHCHTVKICHTRSCLLPHRHTQNCHQNVGLKSDSPQAPFSTYSEFVTLSHV